MRGLLAQAEVDRVVLVHPYPDQLPELERLADAGEPFIIPSRNRADVRSSWIKYGKNLYEFAGSSLTEWFDIQEELALRAVTFWLAIDKPGVRDVQLAEINRELKLNLVTDWEPVRQADE